MKHFYSLLFCLLFLFSCKTTKPVIQQQQALQTNINTPLLLNDSVFNNAHIGICIYNPATTTYVENYQSNKYFIPASNVKIATCYAAMKYLGDSILGLMYNDNEDTLSIKLIGTGDPTFLHSTYTNQPVLDFLKKNAKKSMTLFSLTQINNKEIKPYGLGWAWDDYNDSYMAERNFFPMYGNVVKFSLIDSNINIIPSYFDILNLPKDLKKTNSFKVQRNVNSNLYVINKNKSKSIQQSVPIKFGFENKLKYSVETNLLNDTLNTNISFGKIDISSFAPYKKIYSQPTDSLLKPMMYNSDNFFAEQTLLMLSLNKLGFMGDEEIIDTLLKTDFKNLPQKPRWVDGSGLSRYNLFTPQDFVFILNKIKQEFDWQRVSTIFPTANQGTLKGYYKNYSNKIFAKTGSVGNVFCIGGFVKTNANKELIFSIMINNYNNSSSSAVRLAVEKYVSQIIENN
jgi:serine-type D-Ala-D-Ala carboxypeptidase/endopeptidase (penicillin-binding protein 4)